MGKIRTELVKRIADDLLEKYPKSFNDVFEQNKQFLKEINFTVSKRLRNRIAGYLTTMMKVKKTQAEETQITEEAPQTSS
ncbi:30S ribosomal protein S17e [Candidatus Bathyarchaeota archaeon]|nr:30S ribosomal protein S17e [Candidatus Bathyarchaeota archaeon]MBS7630654.1 30S ribosomal protein S17e [Candidatus Bathyarchaeota archaeon]